MTLPMGGLRDRLIIESFHRAINDLLTSLGWFNLDSAHTPITFIDGFPDDDDTVEFNTLALSVGPATGFTHELGSLTEEFEMVFFADFFGESDGVSRHLIGDIYEWFRSTEYLDVRDWPDTEDVLFGVEILEDAEARQPPNATQKWMKHWRVASVTIQDVRSHG